MVNDVTKHKGVNQHNYLAYHDERYWAMWSDGPGREDKVGQVVKFATSPNAVTWSEPQLLTPYPPGSAPGSAHCCERTAAGLRWIARGFWQRDGDLLALASLDEAGGFFGKSLALRAFRWEGEVRRWVDLGSILDDAINNFEPLKLPDGTWMMSPESFLQRVVNLLAGAKQIRLRGSFSVVEADRVRSRPLGNSSWLW